MSRHDEQVRRVSGWVRTYAQNKRGLNVAVGLVIFLGIFTAIAGASYVAGQAYRAGNWPVTTVAVTMAVAACAANFWLAFTRAGRQLPDQLTARLLGDEGEATLACPTSKGRLTIARTIAVTFGVCILLQVLFGDGIPLRFRQPVAALYVVPFLVSMWLLQRPATGYLSLLWPILFSLHAVLLMLGAPMLFTGHWESLNFLLPIVGYGLLTHTLNHLYARFALQQVKQLTAGGPL